MRIRKVVENTGIPKRTIYFYMNQKLIEPKEDPVNGYNDFSWEDVNKLIIISKLRSLDFSLADIRAILRFPGMATYYFYQQIDRLNRKIELLRRNVNILGRYFENETTPTDCESLLKSLILMEEYPQIPPLADSFTEQDARIIPLFIWAPYVNQVRSEYQDFIWNKISKRVMADYSPFLHGIKCIISSLQPEQLQYSSDLTSGQAGEIAALNADSIENHIQKMISQIERFLDNKALTEKWNLVYFPFIYPLLTIGYSEISKMMFEMNDEYKRFYDNVCILCTRLWEELHQTDHGHELFQKISDKLLPINWEQNGKGELERMTVFHFSPYAILEKEKIEKILQEQMRKNDPS